MDAIEAMETCRAIRYLKPDPVEDAVIERVIHAATRASSPGNSQGWDFVVIRDRAVKAKLGPVIRERLMPLVEKVPSRPGSESRTVEGAKHLLREFENVPVWIVVCGRKVYPPGAATDQMVDAALYPAAQNLIVAARSSASARPSRRSSSGARTRCARCSAFRRTSRSPSASRSATRTDPSAP